MKKTALMICVLSFILLAGCNKPQTSETDTNLPTTETASDTEAPVTPDSTAPATNEEQATPPSRPKLPKMPTAPTVTDEYSASDEGTLMWAANKAMPYAKKWKQDAQIYSAELNLVGYSPATPPDNELDDGSIKGSAKNSGNVVVLWFVSPSSEGYCYRAGVSYDYEGLVNVTSTGYGEANGPNCGVFTFPSMTEEQQIALKKDASTPVSNWKIDSDKLMVTALALKKPEEIVNTIHIFRAQKGADPTCALLNEFPSDHALFVAYFGQKRSFRITPGDREMYIDGTTGEYVGYKSWDMPPSCKK